MRLPLSLEQVFGFFSDASNLEGITPPELCFQIVTPAPISMEQGTRIDYRLRLFGAPMTWRTRISHWDPPRAFVDEQLEGPYSAWVHLHRFEARGRHTAIHDEVRFRLPLYPLGEIALPFVAILLRRIFSFRHRKIAEILVGEEKPPDTRVSFNLYRAPREPSELRNAHDIRNHHPH